ncbi:phosphate ABC transporter ATP-binding protein [Oceanobacillus profundus]|uniref:ABC transporter ATP-binding protein n=1 Tax=Oceanobacillus TaxID=182709 RepID=UPI000BA5EE3F|nr:phosphate ABC transporter ATP-binding protein [Oceanobacillus profundus]MBR3117849.1 phosphate ABC transporter ATP-binding protein [Oceanobacillus sp.]MDO6448700.1 phosphate ABC transporter ATP-binding protein [Oceanobacillus profundus]PAE28957.1 phosphate ABC transporter ATP-binding protein [Paenibacillus sp. 7884-2]
MTASNNTVIQLNHVNYFDGDVHILKDITGSFPEGKITTLVGPSGAGKTTLFRLCNGLISPKSGEIYIKNKPITDYEPTTLRRNIGLALQSATMISGTVFSNLALPLTLQGKQLKEEKAKELLRDVRLDEEFLYRNVKDLSGGQRQKVSVARTLVNRPKVLLLDEITSSLDRVSQQDIEELIVKINQKYRTTIIWITHNLQQALSVGDYTWVMMNGEVVETGETSLLDNPQDERVKQFVEGVNV